MFPFFAAHIPGGYYANFFVPDGKGYEQQAAKISLPKTIKTPFILRMFFIICRQKRPVEKGLFAFNRQHIMGNPIFRGISIVPFKTLAFSRIKIVFHMIKCI